MDLSTTATLRHTHSRAARLVLIVLACVMRSLCSASEERNDFFSEEAPLHLEITVSTNHFTALNQKSRHYAPVLVAVRPQRPVPAGFRLRGVSSFQPMDGKPAFALKLEEAVSRKAFGGLSKILFNNCATDNCAMREHLACSLFPAAGVPAARTRLVAVTINERPCGVYGHQGCRCSMANRLVKRSGGSIPCTGATSDYGRHRCNKISSTRKRIPFHPYRR